MIPRQTKIICTIGPASSGVDNLLKLIDYGMDAARLNFSHGTHEIHLETIAQVREASKKAGKHIVILQDLQGPKIRTGKVENGSVFLNDGDEFIITVDEMEFGNSQKVNTSYKNLIKEVKVGNTILLDDGYIILSINSIKKNDIISKVVKGGYLKDNKGIIAPGSSSTAPSLSEKDLNDLKFGLDSGIDAVALSFVRSERDILELRTTMKIFGRVVPIIAKIERFEGYEDIDDIINEADGIMVARGDLGLEMPAENVPMLQKEIIAKCNIKGKPVIIATQMLESMIQNPRPTRAEASDVANAVIDQTDCVMLSGETSIGNYPFDAVDYMHRIIMTVETKFKVDNIKVEHIDSNHKVDTCDALGKASYVIAEQINAKAIVCLTTTGSTVLNIAKYRPNMPIIAFTHEDFTLNKLTFVKGVTPHLIDKYEHTNDIYGKIIKHLNNYDYLQNGDYIVFVAGLSSENVFTDNIIKIQIIGNEYN
jgi:pyruvate kinase